MAEIVSVRVWLHSVSSQVNVEGVTLTKVASLDVNVSESWQGDVGQIIGSSSAIEVLVELPSCREMVEGVDEIFGRALAGAAFTIVEINKTISITVEFRRCSDNCASPLNLKCARRDSNP